MDNEKPAYFASDRTGLRLILDQTETQKNPEKYRSFYLASIKFWPRWGQGEGTAQTWHICAE
ncbi:hypothetical protein [Microbulbifer aggregans]|uniref:hypothetical protein n=1 Tax=Microbulbifer aggregans TaxID=1769779 RepID=UPI001CFC800F|nr:hypothetical protein [Microbulbifer aggregans]